MGVAQSKVGWFSTAGRPGDRTLEQQLSGLGRLVENCVGKTVLDVGCAEGLISIYLAKAGALAVDGVEIVRGHVDVARKLAGELPVSFECADCNVWRPRRHYDIVIALALLQKVRDPSALCAALADAAREMVVLRLPPEHAPKIIDARSGNVVHDIANVMRDCGFHVAECGYTGHLGEHVSYWVRQ